MRIMVQKRNCKFLKNHNMNQMIKCSMRITMRSKTCIDHIYCNNVDLYAHSGVVDPGLSDHCLTYIVRKRKRPSQAKKPFESETIVISQNLISGVTLKTKIGQESPPVMTLIRRLSFLIVFLLRCLTNTCPGRELEFA